MNFIDTDLRLQRAPGEIRASATAPDESKINGLFACFSQVYERHLGQSRGGPLPLFTFLLFGHRGGGSAIPAAVRDDEFESKPRGGV